MNSNRSHKMSLRPTKVGQILSVKELIRNTFRRSDIQVRPVAPRRSKSVDERPAARANRASSDERGVQAPLRGRSKSIDKRPNPVNGDAFHNLAEANALLSIEFIKVKNELEAKNKRIEFMQKQDVGNRKLIADLTYENKEKDEVIAGLNERMTILLRSGRYKCCTQHNIYLCIMK